MSSLSKYSILIPVCNHDYVTVCFLILEVCSQYEQQNKSLFAKLSHSCPPLEISRHLISATGVYWIAILIAHGALTEYFFTWGWRKVRRQGTDMSSSSITRRFALDLRKPHRKKTGSDYYCMCASQLQLLETQPRWAFQSALLSWNHFKITNVPSLRKFDNSTREFILQSKWPFAFRVV